jgi:hypothetical protein
VKLVDLLDLIRADNPNYPTTQPLDLPADLTDAARVVLDRPVYLDPLGKLWITHTDGKPAAELLRQPIKTQTIFVRETIRFVHYGPGGKPMVFSSAGETITLNSGQRTIDLPAAPDWRWDAAFSWNNSVIVPTSLGAAAISDLTTEPKVEAWNVYEKDSPPDCTLPIVYPTPTDVLIWGPWDNGQTGSDGAMRFGSGDPVHLSAEAGWLGKPLQFVPLQDGSVLAIGLSDAGPVLKLAGGQTGPPDEAQQAKIPALARKLADRDPVIREATQRELESMGAGIYPTLESLLETLPPEAQIRIESILGQRFAPTIAGLRPLEGRVQTAARMRNGGVVLKLDGGGMFEESGKTQSLIPAWIAIRPGQFVERMNPALTSDFVVGRHNFAAAGSEWIIIDPTLGPRRWLGAKAVTLLPKPLRHFDDFLGIDSARRWVFRSTSQPGKTLLLDPALPDLTPKLPVWVLDAPDGAGRTSINWPGQKRGKQIFVLGERGWRGPDAGETFNPISAAGGAGPETALSEESTATNAETTYRVTAEAIFIASNAGPPRTFTWPAEAAPQPPLAAFWTEQRLFVVDATGTIRRLRPTPDGLALFEIETTFKQQLPTAPVVAAWLDPAGRIILADETTLWITFPTGRVPRGLANLIMEEIPNDE